MNKRSKLMAASAAYILGLSPQLKIKGENIQIEALKEVLKTSKKLYESFDKIQESSELAHLLEEKSSAAQKFKNSFGYHWPF